MSIASDKLQRAFFLNFSVFACHKFKESISLKLWGNFWLQRHSNLQLLTLNPQDAKNNASWNIWAQFEISPPLTHGQWSRGRLLLVRTKDRDLWEGPICMRREFDSRIRFALSMRRVTGSPWIENFRCLTFPEGAILGADQKKVSRDCD